MFAFQCVQAKRTQREVLWACRNIQGAQNAPQLGGVRRLNAFAGVVLVERLEPLVLEADDHAGLYRAALHYARGSSSAPPAARYACCGWLGCSGWV